MHTDRHRLNVASGKVIGCAFEVANALGSGFLEKVYQNALLLEIRLCGLQAEKEKLIKIAYRGEIVGEYFADILVDNMIIVETKAVQDLNEIHQAQLLNYLKAANLPLGLLINFAAPRVQIKRMLNENSTQGLV